MALRYRKISPLKHIIYPDCLTIIPEIDLHDGLRILDVGCGKGKLLFKIADILKKSEIKGIDISKKVIEYCTKKNKYSNIEFLVSPVDNLLFDDDYFDIITCTNSIDFFPQRVRAIDEIYRVLKPGGKFFLLNAFNSQKWRKNFDKMLRQTKFIQPRKKYLPRSSILSKSYLVIATK